MSAGWLPLSLHIDMREWRRFITSRPSDMTPVTCERTEVTLGWRAGMTLSSLLLCADEASSSVLRQVLEELKIRVEVCPDAKRAAIRIAQERYDMVILDCSVQRDVVDVLRETRVSRMNDSTLAVVIVPAQENVRELFSLGVNFVLYKPVAYERALSSLRAARAVMRKEKRRSARTAVHAHAVVDYANVEQERATLVDLAENGMSVLFGKKMPPTSKVYFQFQLPGQPATVRLSGTLVWQDWNGRAGVQFADVPKASRKLLNEFLSKNLPKNSSEAPVSDVTVEVHANHELPENGAAATATAVATSTATEVGADPNDRRGETRYPCRLGAEVYQVGIAIPHFCSLTDLSPGGCYLEVHTPFPKGVKVEITVRTFKLKLRLMGTVQSAHPCYGMGVAFDLATDEEREQVRLLTEFVAASIPNS